MNFAGDSWFAPDALDATLANVAIWPPTQYPGALPGMDTTILAPELAEPSWIGIEGGLPAEPGLGLPTPEDSSPGSQSDVPAVPSLDVLLDLVDVFYERIYPSLPIIHRGKLTSRLREGGADGIPSILLYAILTVASGAHPNPQIRDGQAHWRSLARAAFKRFIPTEYHPLETLQAALLLVYDAPLQGDYPATWMMLGEAWRKAAVISYHQIDADKREPTAVQYLGSTDGLGWREREECRRVVWMFFILDRGLCYPIGLVHAVDDRRLIVDFPMAEAEFQGAEEPVADRPAVRYTRDMDTLIARVEEHGRKRAATTLHYIVLAYVLLGRVTEEVYAEDAEHEKQAAALDVLTKQLSHVRRILPGYAGDIAAAPSGEVPYVIWLSAIMSVNTVFLHHRSLRTAADGTTNAAVVEAAWPHAVLSARGTAQLLRDGFRSGGGGSLIVAHTTTALFVSTRVLIMEYMSPGTDGDQMMQKDAALRSDLEVLAAANMQIHSSMGILAKKFILGFKFHMRMDVDAVRSSKDVGAKGLLQRCGDWSQADDGEDIMIPE